MVIKWINITAWIYLYASNDLVRQSSISMQNYVFFFRFKLKLTSCGKIIGKHSELPPQCTIYWWRWFLSLKNDIIFAINKYNRQSFYFIFEHRFKQFSRNEYLMFVCVWESAGAHKSWTLNCILKYPFLLLVTQSTRIVAFSLSQVEGIAH